MLRIPAVHEAVHSDLFNNTQHIKNLNVAFLSNGP